MHFRRRDDRIRRRLRGEQPLSRLLPNMITIAGMCCGLSSIRFAMTERWEMAVGFILAAAIIDGMDGRVARMLGATSHFGAQLDSLSDFLCFGVAPALVVYLWALHDMQGIGWAAVLFFSVCTALRLARFNTGLFEEKEAEWKKQFFIGVPSPAGGILCLLPLIASLQLQTSLPAWLLVLHLVIVGTLMASRIPTFSGKKIRIRHELIPPFMIAASLLLALFIIEPWWCLILVGTAYLATIPLSIKAWKKYEQTNV
ncbi:MAG: CDP-diacylglycerol--serine O-phosphatidyltransferase [Alphaproteobacteria bacterium]|nr:CDP-diacylglycerol--serine O-phosphatidyltransferase [Alphaproteobacteria bacterium]